jgi:hypothetical protein
LARRERTGEDLQLQLRLELVANRHAAATTEDEVFQRSAQRVALKPR